MSVEYLDLADYIAYAAAVTGHELQTVMNVTNHDLADSGLHAPAAGVGDTDFSPEFIDKAAVLVVRLPQNHPLPDGNKRAAWVSLRVNGTRLPPPDGCSSTFGHRPADRSAFSICAPFHRRWEVLPIEAYREPRGRSGTASRPPD